MVRFVGGCIFGAALNFWSDVMLKRIWKHFAIARTTSALNRLSDYELKDIGLNRGDIKRIARESV